MKCLVLAAGYATRLYPLTENFPKPLLKVGEKTILDWLLDDIHTSGAVDEYIVVSNHKFVKHFEDWAQAKPYPVTVLDDGTESNETRLGAVCDVQLAIERCAVRKEAAQVRRADDRRKRSRAEHDRKVAHARHALVLPAVLLLHGAGCPPSTERHRRGLRHGRAGQLHRMAVRSDAGTRDGNAGQSL